MGIFIWINTINQFCIREKYLSVLFVCAALLSLNTCLHGKTYNNQPASFSITIPADWVQISKDSVKNIHDLKIARYENFDYLYKIKDSRWFFDFPYILIQVNRPGRYNEHKGLADLADWKLDSINQPYLLTMDENFYLEKSTGRVWQKTILGDMTRITVFFPLKQFSYNVFFFSKKEDLPKYLPAFFRILSSFKEEKPEFFVMNFNRRKTAYFMIAAFIGLIALISFQRYPKLKIY